MEHIMKTINNLISKIRIKLNDRLSLEFSDDEILSYIHVGITQLEMLLLSNRVKFNITLLNSPLNTCPVPDDLLEIHKIIIDNVEIPLKNEYDKSFGYFIMNNSIILPANNAEIYYIKEYERYSLDDEINMPSSYIDYLYLFASIKALSRLEYNMDKEEKELLQLANTIVKTALSKNGTYTLKRYNGFAL